MAILTNSIIQPEEITNGGILRIAPLNQQFNPDTLAPHIEIAEITHVVDALGRELYDDIITQKNGVISNYNDNCGDPLQEAFPNNQCYEDFWTKALKRLCATATVYVSLPFIYVEITNNGLQIPTANFSQTGGNDGLQILKQAVGQQLETMRQQVRKYIKENKDCLPLACCDECECNYTNCECDDNSCPKPPVQNFGLYTPKNNLKRIKNNYNNGFYNRTKY